MNNGKVVLRLIGTLWMGLAIVVLFNVKSLAQDSSTRIVIAGIAAPLVIATIVALFSAKRRSNAER